MSETVEENMVEQQDEKLPISEFYKIIDYVTIFKSAKWWEAVAVVESLGKRFIAMYMWHFKDGKWRRKHKFHIRGTDDWSKVKSVVEQFLPRISGDK